jgi:hypothetical protein
MKCVGGTAGCTAFVPKLVQCYNRGSDGIDIQWECKTEMDNEYKFGKIQVTCEGYDKKHDPYIFRDSCGLIYKIDFKQERPSRLKLFAVVLMVLSILALTFWLCYKLDKYFVPWHPYDSFVYHFLDGVFDGVVDVIGRCCVRVGTSIGSSIVSGFADTIRR